MATRAQRPELERLPDVIAHLGHDDRPETGSLAPRRRRDRLNVAGPERAVSDVDPPLDHRRVADDRAVDLEDEMEAAERMSPVVVAEALLLVRPERLREQASECCDLGGRQLVGGEPSKTKAGGIDALRCAYPVPLSVSAIRARTSFVTRSSGSGESGVNLIVPFDVS